METELASPDRRTVVRTCALVTLGLVAVPTLAACGGDDAAGSTGSAAAGGATTSAAAGESSSAAAGGAALAKVSDVPVGGALVTKGTDGKPIALVQQEAGTVTAVSAVCTHMGTQVAVDGTTLKCPAHGSVFSFDGSVEKGPATKSLAALPVKVEGDEVVAG